MNKDKIPNKKKVFNKKIKRSKLLVNLIACSLSCSFSRSLVLLEAFGMSNLSGVSSVFIEEGVGIVVELPLVNTPMRLIIEEGMYDMY